MRIALSEHHATVTRARRRPAPAGNTPAGDSNHVRLTTNLVSDAVVRDATLIDRWKVAARGKKPLILSHLVTAIPPGSMEVHTEWNTWASQCAARPDS